jgi:DNA mismatch repair protein MutL
VKFADTEVILQILQAAVRESLAKTGAVPMMDFSADNRVEIPVMRREQTVYKEPRSATNSAYNPFSAEYIDPSAPMPDVPFTGFDVPYDEPATPPVSRDYVEEASQMEYAPRPMSQPTTLIEYIDDEGLEEQTTFDYIESAMSIEERRTFSEVLALPSGYAIAIYGSQSVVVSLRRAKERVLYEEILRSMTQGAAPTQRMFFPEELMLSEEEYSLMEQHAEEFAALGFEIEYRGGGAIAVEGRPAMIDTATPLDELIYELLKGIDLGEVPLNEERRRMAELMARRGSAGYGRSVRSQEAQELLQRLAQCDDTSFTASGSPTMAKITADELRAKLTKN